MTRKHFEAIAAALHATRPGTPGHAPTEADPAALNQWYADISAMADIFADLNLNPNFNRSAFRRAAYHGKGKGTPQ